MSSNLLFFNSKPLTLSSWAGYNLTRQLDTKKFQPVVVSPRSYFVFTPLLASTAVGTLEFRTTLEPVRKRSTGVEFFQGWAEDVNFDMKRLTIEESGVQRNDSIALTGDVGASESGGAKQTEKKAKKGKLFDIRYDKLVVAVGCYNQTFNTPGVRENALFLKDVGDARKIRKRILDCFETAALPTTPEHLKKYLLNFAIVGGGPTGVEFSAELHDLCHEDLRRLYPDLAKYVHITIYDVAPNILSMFDSSLANYALETFRRDGIEVKTEHHIQELRQGLPDSERNKEVDDEGCLTLKTKEDGEVGIGMCVWSTGLMMNPFVRKAMDIVHTYPRRSAHLHNSLPNNQTPSDLHWVLKHHPKTGGLMVNDRFQVKIVAKKEHDLNNNEKLDSAPTPEAIVRDVFAIGDVCVMEKGQLPATAQVANQQSKWLAKRLNKGDLNREAFTFRNLGVMTYLGNMRAIMQTGSANEIKGYVM